MSEIVLLLSGVVVKTAFKIWSGESALAENLSADLTDLIKAKVSGPIEQLKIRSRFARLEEIVADRILSALEHEFRALDDGDKNAAIHSVADTIEAAKLTDKVLFAEDLDPLYLQRYIRGTTDIDVRDLGLNGGALYDRLLAESCAYIIEIADKLPSFHAGAYTELLRRDRQILDRIKEVLERLPSVRDNPLEADRIEVAYRQRIVKKFDRLELFGLDFSAKQYSLSLAYVHLTVSGHREDIPHLEERLVKQRRILLSGRAGCGKTTVLQWLAVRTARRDFTGEATVLNKCTPFFIRLRDYVGRSLPTPDQFMDAVAPLLAPEAKAGGWLGRQLRNAPPLLLVDGVDEIPESERPAVLDWLQELTDLFSDSYIVVTTRPSAIDVDWQHDLNFVLASLDTMEPALIKVFIERWHSAAQEWLTEDESCEELKTYERALLLTISDDPFLRDLADTPLLAGLICALNQHLKAQLPKRRGEIYEKAIAMFEQRDRARGIKSDGPVLDLPAILHLLGELALWLVRNSHLDAPKAAAETVLSVASRALSIGSNDGDQLYRHLLVRSGLLREPSTGRVDFVHRTFQEYLAARALISVENIGEILKNADDDQWREIVILACGLGNINQATELLRGLMRSTSRGKSRYRRRMLAVASLREIKAVDPNVRRTVEISIAGLLPPRTMEQAEALSQAGEVLIPLLSEVTPGHLTEAEAIVRTCALVGGAQAMDVIARVARNTGAMQMIDELVRAWGYFDASAYGEAVMNIQPIDRLLLSRANFDILPGIARLNYLENLRLDLQHHDVDLSFLQGCQNLKILYLIAGASGRLTLPSGIQGLRKVRIAEWRQLRDVSALRDLTAPSLRELEIVGCESLRDLRPIVALKSLRVLIFERQPVLDLEPLLLLPNLKEIRVDQDFTAVAAAELARHGVTILRSANAH